MSESDVASSVGTETELARVDERLKNLQKSVDEVKNSFDCFRETRREVDKLVIFEKQSRSLELPKRVSSLEGDRKYVRGAIAVLASVAGYFGYSIKF